MVSKNRHPLFVLESDRHQSLRITVYNHLASLMMPNNDSRGQIFLSHPHTHDWFLYAIKGLHCIYYYFSVEDIERNDGSNEKPYFMSKQLMKILGKKNLASKLDK